MQGHTREDGLSDTRSDSVAYSLFNADFRTSYGNMGAMRRVVSTAASAGGGFSCGRFGGAYPISAYSYLGSEVRGGAQRREGVR